MSARNPHLLPDSAGPLLCYDVPTEVTAENYTLFLNDVRTSVETYGEFRVLLLYGKFESWQEEAAEMDISFYLEYGRYFKKFCLVGPPEKEIMAKMISSSLIAGELKIFCHDKYEEAVAWAKA